MQRLYTHTVYKNCAIQTDGTRGGDFILGYHSYNCVTVCAL